MRARSEYSAAKRTTSEITIWMIVLVRRSAAASSSAAASRAAATSRSAAAAASQRLVHRLPQWFDFDRDTGEELRLRTEHGWEPLQPYKFVTHITKVKSSIPIRGGLARAAAWAWLFKTFTLKDWMRFVEAYGHPLRLGKYPPNADPEGKAVLYRAVRNVAADAAAIVPEGMNIEFVDDTTVRGRAEVFKEFVAYLDSRVSIAVLGQTLTTEQGDRGSQALGNVHQMVREDIEESDARQLAGVLRRDSVIPVVALNHGMREAYPRVVIERKEERRRQAARRSTREAGADGATRARRPGADRAPPG